MRDEVFLYMMPGSKGLNPHELAHKWMKESWDPPQYEPRSGMTIPRYANNWEDCESAKHGTIRRHHSWGFCPNIYIFDHYMSREELKMGVVSYVKEEIQVIRERDPAIKSNMEVFLYPSFKAILHYRVAHKLYKKGHYVMARWISQRAVRKTGIEIHPGATIGKGLFIDHGSGVIIGETAELGDNITLYQGVTLGGTGKEQGKRHPTLGDNVMVSAGAKVLGSFKIGENSKIGAGSVVLKEVPANCTVVGVPGRIVKQDGAKIPRMDMNQVDLPDPISNDIKELQVDNLRMHKKLMELENQLKMVAHAQCAKEEKEQ